MRRRFSDTPILTNVSSTINIHSTAAFTNGLPVLLNKSR